MSLPTFSASMFALPSTTRGLLLAFFAFSLLLFIVRHHEHRTDPPLEYPYLVLVPGKVLYTPWTLITSAFVEVGFLGVVSSAGMLVMSGRYLERVWGGWELLLFVLWTVGTSNIILVVVSTFEGLLLDWHFFMKEIYYSGFSALNAGFLVAFTQIIPEHKVQIFGVLNVRVKSLPMAYVTLSNILCIVGFQSPYILIQFGWLTSWFYLRFLKRESSTLALAPGEFVLGTASNVNVNLPPRGDRSETFAFKNWFPPVAQPYVGMACEKVFNLLVSYGLFRDWAAVYDTVSGRDLEAGQYEGLDAEKRRALALQALDQRMTGASSSSHENQGDLGLGTAAVLGSKS